MKNIAVVDYGIGNVKSMMNALTGLNVSAILTNSKQKILASDGLILPGVGAFGKGMENLKNFDLIETLNKYVQSGKPLLGVCLGMQMLLEESEEFQITKGLGFIKGRVVKMQTEINSKDKLPHVSWNELIEPENNKWDNTILKNVSPLSDVYFVHSYISVPENSEDVLAQSEYGEKKFCSAIHKKNVYGTQFHPEKSAKVGQLILNNFISII
jgi:glutamine amidotransferase